MQETLSINSILLTAKELSGVLKLKLGTVYHLLETGQIPGARKYGRSWRILWNPVLESHHVSESASCVQRRKEK